MGINNDTCYAHALESIHTDRPLALLLKKCGNWENEKFRVFPIYTSVDITICKYGKNVLYFFYNIAQRTLTEEWREIFRVYIELCKHGS